MKKRVKKNLDKKAISKNLILFGLIIAIAIVLFIIIRGMINENKESLGIDDSDIEISQVLVVNDSVVNIKIKKNTEEKEYEGVLFRVYDKDNNEIKRYNISMSELQQNNFEMNFLVGEVSEVEKISLSPIIISVFGKQKISNVEDEIFSEEFNKIEIKECILDIQCNDNLPCTQDVCSGNICFHNKIISCMNNDGCCPSGCTYSKDKDCKSSGGGGGGGGSTTCTDTCASLVKQCGVQNICGVNINCGTCLDDYYCSTSGLCLKNNTCVPNCANKNCGSDGCGRNCGTCLDGYACALNGTCIKEGSNVKYLVKEGIGNAEIIISSSASNMTKLAAKHLQLYINNITGALLPIKNAVNSSINYHIYVGQSNYTDALGINDNDCKYGSFKIISAENYLVLLGNDDLKNVTGPYSLRWSSEVARVRSEWTNLTGEYWDSPYDIYYKNYNPKFGIWETDGRGTMNAVYEFLYKQGMRWYYPGEIGTIIPSKKNISISDMNEHIKPDFAVRLFAQYYNKFGHNINEDELKWQFSLLMNPGIEVIGMTHGHGTDLIISRSEMKAAHPEYYAIWGGIRMNGSDQKPDLCSEELFNQNVNFVKAVFDIYGDPMVSVMPSDGFDRASESSTECKARETPERGYRGKISDYVWGYVNRVALEVYKTHPEKKISGCAYTAYALPPEDIEQMAPNIAIIFCRWRGWFVGNPEEKIFWRNLTYAWLEKLPSKETYVWDYYLYNRPNGTYESIPVVFPHLISEDLKWLKGKSNGEYIEVVRNYGPYNLSWDVFAANALNVYITSRLYWDADQDVDALLNEYYTLYYGPASEKMKEFVEYSEQNYPDADENPVRLTNLRRIAMEAKAIAGNTVYGERIDMLLDLMNSRYIGEEATISSCKILDSPTTEYKLNSDVISPGTCFIIAGDGITLDCQGHTITYATNGSSQYGVNLNGENYFNITNCVIKNGSSTAGQGIYIANSDGGEIKNNNISVSATGIYVTGSFNVSVQKNIVTSLSGVGIYISGVNNTELFNNNARSISNMGMYLYNTHNSVITKNNASSDTNYGGELMKNTNNTFKDNLFTTNTGNGLWLYQSNGNYFFRNNAISRDRIGLRLYGSSANNQFTEQTAIGGSYGIEIAGTSIGNTFQNCKTIKGNTKNVSISSDSTGNLFTNCVY